MIKGFSNSTFWWGLSGTTSRGLSLGDRETRTIGWRANSWSLRKGRIHTTPSFALAMLIIDFVGVARGYRGLIHANETEKSSNMGVKEAGPEKTGPGSQRFPKILRNLLGSAGRFCRAFPRDCETPGLETGNPRFS